MPVYAYACTACGASLEVRQSFADAALTECPTCGGSLRKRYDSIGVTFNGTGFYRTDSRAAAASAASSSESKSSTEKSSSSPKPAATSGAPTSGE